MQNLYVITGQTATGKTDAAIRLAREKNGELINCDARQLYKKLDIVTGKDLTDHRFHPQRETENGILGFYYLAPGIKIWLYDLIDPSMDFSAGNYRQAAGEVIADIVNRGKTPIFVGGSAFYLYYLLTDKPARPTRPDTILRKKLETLSLKQLQLELERIDMKAFRSLNSSDIKNPYRLIRRIESAHGLPGIDNRQTPISGQSKLGSKLLHTSIDVYLNDNAGHTRAKIAMRVEKRLKQGAIEEVSRLLAEGYTAQSSGLKTIGYPEIISYLKGDLDLAAMKETWATKEYQYAKRQKTYLMKFFPESGFIRYCYV